MNPTSVPLQLGQIAVCRNGICLEPAFMDDQTFKVVAAPGGQQDTSRAFTVTVSNQQANTTVTLNTGAQTGSRTVSLPVFTGNDTLAALNVANVFTATQAISMSAQNQLILTSTASSSQLFLKSATGFTSSVNFAVNGVTICQIGGNATNPYYVQDTQNSNWNPVVYTPGAVSSGFLTYAGTLDASSSSVAANVMTGGLAVGKQIQTGSNITSTGSTLVWAINSSSGNATIGINGATGANARLVFQINSVNQGILLANATSAFTFDDLVNSWNPLVYTTGTTSAGFWTFAGTLATTSEIAGAVVIGNGTAATSMAFGGGIIRAGVGYGVNATPTASVPVFAIVTQNGDTAIRTQNASSGAAASATLVANNGTHVGQLTMYGTSFTTSGVNRQDGMQLISNGAGGININANNAGGIIDFATGGAVRGNISNIGQWTVAPGVLNANARHVMQLTCPADTLVTSGTEQHDLFVSSTRTVQWATTVPTTQRSIRIGQPTYACDTAGQTITTAATVAILGAPINGTNVTITNAFALWVQAGITRLDGSLTLAGGTLLATSAALTNNAAAQTATMTNGPTAGNPTKWIPINDNGTTRNIPAW